MPKARLTKRLIDGLVAGPKDLIYWDTELRGFGCKVTPPGKKVLIVQYRFGGRGSRVRKYTIGPYGVVTLKKAQEQALRVLAEKTQGVDPQAEKSARRKRLGSDYVADQFERFCETHASQTRTEQEARRIFGKDVLPHIGNRSVHTIKKRELVEILNTVQGRGAGIMANRVLAAMRKFFNWLVSQAILDASPCAGIGAPTPERSRDRVLTDDELGRVLKAAQLLDYPFGVIVQLLAHTGQRRDEVAGMRWSELELEKRLWKLPGARTKNTRAHDVALTPQVVELIEQCQNVSPGQFVASLSAERPFQGWSNAKAALDQKAQVSGWRLHDLRRTMVTYMARAGVAQHVSDRILNHKSGVISSVAAVYQQHDFASERREALFLWSNHLAELCDTVELT